MTRSMFIAHQIFLSYTGANLPIKYVRLSLNSSLKKNVFLVDAVDHCRDGLEGSLPHTHDPEQKDVTENFPLACY